jgi:hypothetical protein
MRCEHEALWFFSATLPRATRWHFGLVLACRCQRRGRDMLIDRDATGVLDKFIKPTGKTDENRLL